GGPVDRRGRSRPPSAPRRTRPVRRRGRHHRRRGNGGNAAQRGRGAGAAAGDCRADERRVRRVLRWPGRAARHAQLLRIGGAGGEHRQWLRGGGGGQPDPFPMSKSVVIQLEEPRFTWIDIVAPEPGELEAVAAEYGLFPTLVADSLEPEHLPKYERVGETIFVIVRAYDEQSAESAATVQSFTRKVAIFAGPDFVITVHRSDQPFLVALRERYAQQAERAAAARLEERRRTLATRLLVELVNAAVDTYDKPLERLEARLDEIEDEL